MKKLNYLLAIALIVAIHVSAQESEETMYYPLIGQKAPTFTAESTHGELKFPNDFKKSWKILLSHPADFTPVCTSELLELCKAQSDFTKMNVQFAVLSTDLIDRHKHWVESIESIEYKDIKNAKVEFPLIADPKLEASKMYGMIHPNSGTTKDVRGVFIIDPENNIRSILFYPMEVGRNIEEIKRTVLALQKHDSDRVLTPANWTAGDDVIVPYFKGVSSTNAPDPNDENVYSVAWYLHMKKETVMAVKE